MKPEAASDGLDRRRFLKGVTAGAVTLGLTGAAGRVFGQKETRAAERVRKRTLGRTGLEVSVIAYGTVSTGPQHLPLLRMAYEQGINLFDTAWGYGRGRSETALGAFVEAVKDRESFYIVTKASGFRPPRGSSKEVYEAFKRRLKESLARLRTDYVDLFYWPHGASSPAQIRNRACQEALLKLKEEGLIRHIGTSSHSNYAAVGAAVLEDGFYEVMMPVLNICTQNKSAAGRVRKRALDDTRTLLEGARRKRLGIVAMKAANPNFLGAETDALLDKAFPEDSGLSRHQKLYSYVLAQKGVSSVVVGIGSARHLTEALAVGRAAPA